MKYEEIRKYLLFNCSLQIGYYKSKNDDYKFAIFDIDSKCPKYKFNPKNPQALSSTAKEIAINIIKNLNK